MLNNQVVKLNTMYQLDQYESLIIQDHLANIFLTYGYDETLNVATKSKYLSVNATMIRIHLKNLVLSYGHEEVNSVFKIVTRAFQPARKVG